MVRPRALQPLLRCALVIALGAQACSSDDDDDALAADASGGEASDASGGDSTGSSDDLDALYDCEDPNLTVVQPLAGPGYDPQAGLLEPLQDTYVVHTTQLLVKPDDASQAEFTQRNNEITAQLMQTPGLVAVSIAIEPQCGFSRTLGIWRSEEDMYAFAGSGAHAQAMGRTTALSITGKVTHWEVNADAMPVQWSAAIEQIDAVEPSAVYGP